MYKSTEHHNIQSLTASSNDDFKIFHGHNLCSFIYDDDVMIDIGCYGCDMFYVLRSHFLVVADKECE